MLFEWQGHVLAYGHGTEKRATLKRHAEALANFVALDFGDGGKILAANPDLAGGWLLEANQRAQERAFAGAGAAEDDQSLAGLHVKINAVQNFPAGVADAKIAERKHRALERLPHPTNSHRSNHKLY